MIKVEHGDLLKYRVDAIVNPANPSFLIGGGVSGKIAAAAGEVYYEQCALAKDWLPLVGGKTIVTVGGNLPASHVIHAAGPTIYAKGVDGLLMETVAGIIRTMRKHGFSQVAMPVISSGIFGVPFWRAFRIILHSAIALMDPDHTLTVVIWEEENVKHAQTAFARAQAGMERDHSLGNKVLGNLQLPGF